MWTLTAPNAPPPTSTTVPPPTATGTELHWQGPTGQQCLGLTIRGASDGTIVNMYVPLTPAQLLSALLIPDYSSSLQKGRLYPLLRPLQEHPALGDPRQELCRSHPIGRDEPVPGRGRSTARQRSDPQDLDLVGSSVSARGRICHADDKGCSYPGLYQQTWYRTADDHLAIVGDSTFLLAFLHY